MTRMHYVSRLSVSHHYYSLCLLSAKIPMFLLLNFPLNVTEVPLNYVCHQLFSVSFAELVLAAAVHLWQIVGCGICLQMCLLCCLCFHVSFSKAADRPGGIAARAIAGQTSSGDPGNEFGNFSSTAEENAHVTLWPLHQPEPRLAKD